MPKVPSVSYSAGIKTPIKNTSNSANFGYDIDKTIIQSDGSAASATVSTSDVAGTGTGTLTITSDGVISDGDPNDYWFMNASKDVMYQFFKDNVTGEQQLSVFVKKAD